MTNLVFCGVGSRGTPLAIQKEMTEIGRLFREHGFYVRSGHADGADYSFEEGARENTIAYLPWLGFNSKLALLGDSLVVQGNKELDDMVIKFHPEPASLSAGAFKLMRRNSCQVLGRYLDSPARAVICWTQGALPVGGTSQAIRIAHAYKVPVINMAHPHHNTADKVMSALNVQT